jgi:hypothetical protein
MTPERRKCAIKEALQRRPLLDNGSLGMFPRQRIDLYKPKRCMEMWIPGDRLGTERVFRLKGQATNVLLGHGTLYKRSFS